MLSAKAPGVLGNKSGKKCINSKEIRQSNVLIILKIMDSTISPVMFILAESAMTEPW
jgi:hypothetical protein